MSEWHQSDVPSVASRLETDRERGLNGDQAARRLAEHGPNELLETGGRGPWQILWEQVTEAMVVLLLVAAGVSFLLHEYTDGIAILVIVVLNAILGFFQDFRAERAMAALKKLAVPRVHVRRAGEVLEISARDLVTGDLVLLEAGNLVPADCRVTVTANLRVQEAALTGESEAVEKSSAALPQTDMALGDRTNMVYMGTVVTYGRGEVLVTATGMDTELGHVAKMLQRVHRDPTPLQRRLARLGRGLAVAALVIVALVFLLGLLRGESVRLMLMTAMSMAVAAVPEGLPAVATVALAIGASRMLRRNALIRKLPAVETLGSVTVICSDKTGTLTENRMTVEILDFAGDRLDLVEHLRHGEPTVEPGEFTVIANQPALALLVAGGVLCNDATLQADPEPGHYHAVGDPTEGALVVAAARVGLLKTDLEHAFQRVAEVPFDSSRKCMTTIHRVAVEDDHLSPALHKAIASIPDFDHWPYIAFTKGAVDRVLELTQQVWVDEHAEPLDDAWRERIETAHNRMAGNGMRVLGLALRRVDALPQPAETQGVEDKLVFVGMMAMINPPRAEVKQAVQRCRTAGIRPIMITGDHPLTASHIAEQLGIGTAADAITGTQLSEMSDEQLAAALQHVSVFARVSPEHKLKIVEILQKEGQIVAMTGDGVNDAPALKKADIGVAMGITGTDVSKEASDTVLLDDNFATIVNAVEEGRIIYDNIRKFLKYTMTSNAGEIWVMLLAPFLGMPLPLLPLQILWVNLVTDGLPGLALALEPAERNTMSRPPFSPKANIVDRRMAGDILWIGLLMGAVSLSVGYFFWLKAPTKVFDPSWGTIIFTVLTLSQMGNVLALRSGRDSLFQIGVFSNPLMIGAVALTLLLQLAVIYVPYLQKVFHTVPLDAHQLLLCLAISSVVFFSVELQKWVLRRLGT